MNRRCFLESIAAATALGGAGCRIARPGGAASKVIDTHTHFYDPRRPGGVPWPPKEDGFLYRPVLPPEYERIARPLGIDRTLVVEASPWVSDNDWVLELIRREPFLVGLVGHLNPGQPEFAKNFGRLSRFDRFRGIRIGGADVASAPDHKEILRNLGLLADAGLALDVLVGPEQLPQVARLASALPSLSMVIDHCANVRVNGQEPPRSWREGLSECARHRRIHMKVSGLVEGTGRADGTASRDLAFYRPVLDAIWQSFGEDRVIFGSNWPVSARFAPLDVVHGIVADYFHEHGPVASAKYFGGNATAVYGLATS
ncbi:MAG: amidohydrolase family protein [Verrucomicrobiales bacterium]|nr:amidohydrolase family protein [Verrucomicrobiales bacterium]